MKKVTETLFCDRCGKEAHELYDFGRPGKLWYFQSAYQENEICYECMNSLKKWWKEPSHD